MRLFAEPSAGHYCRGFQPVQSVSSMAFSEFAREQLPPGTALVEGSPAFEEYRSAALRDAERCLLLSASHYRRSLDLMTPASSHWASVTSYYGAWYAATAILHMFGGAVLMNSVVVVEREAAGRQKLKVKKIGNATGQQPVTYQGSHQRFWELFYSAVRPLVPVFEPRLRFALMPVSSDPAWLIDRRNRINYNSSESLALARAFEQSFDPANFPSCLPGILSTHFSVHEGLVELGVASAVRVGLDTDAFDQTWTKASLKQQINRSVYGKSAPGLVRLTQKSAITAR